MTTPETTLAVQPEPVTMFGLTPSEAGVFDLTLITWTQERGYERAVFLLSPRIASAFSVAVEREMADVPPPPPLSRDDLMHIHREIGCAMSVDQPAATLEHHMQRVNERMTQPAN
jgi:hypothetical protein